MARRLVIADIHGCAKTFKALVEKIGLTHEDTLYLLGDYIDRGPDNCGVIDYIIHLQSNNYNIKPL
jgi:serine/threonine protein phosphatase 1